MEQFVNYQRFRKGVKHNSCNIILFLMNVQNVLEEYIRI